MQVALFVTCLTDTFFPRVGEALVRVLRHFGCEAAFPAEQTCCGQPAFNSGFDGEAAKVAQRNIRILDPFERIVTPSASCATMIKRHYAELFERDAEWRSRAEALAAKTFEATTFLRDQLRVDVAQYLRLTEPITFHYPCHARGTYTVDDLQAWLGGADVDLRTPTVPDLCCGFGGVFAVDFPEISGPMLGDKLDYLTATGAKLVICNEAGCGLNMAGGARRRGLELRFKHLVECLAESLNLMEPTA